MTRRSRLIAAAFAVFVAASSSFAGNVRFGTPAADFPPGAFSDGGRYSLGDLEGKVVVLFFYEQQCPSCRKSIPQRNAIVQQFKGKPVRFIGVGAEDSMADVQSYISTTKLAMPVYADPLGLMQSRYGFDISLQNIWQFRVIGPDGKISGLTMDPDDIEKALQGATWKYKDGGYHAKLDPVIEQLEWNQTEAALRVLRLQVKKKDEVGESAKKLYDAVLTEGKQWAEAATAAEASEPIKAFDLYTRVAACFPDEQIGKDAAAAVKKLRAEAPVKDELAARKAFDALSLGLTKAKPESRKEVLAAATQIGKKFKDTPTGQKAAALAEEITALPAAN